MKKDPEIIARQRLALLQKFDHLKKANDWRALHDLKLPKATARRWRLAYAAKGLDGLKPQWDKCGHAPKKLGADALAKRRAAKLAGRLRHYQRQVARCHARLKKIQSALRAELCCNEADFLGAPLDGQLNTVIQNLTSL